jgi:hypothetical protein
MKFRDIGFVFALLLSGCATVPTDAVAPPVLLDIYRDADAYHASADRRLCADPSLTPSLQAVRTRLAAAREALVARYGAAQVDAARVAVVTTPATFCSDKAAAAQAVGHFEKAVSDLEAALK